MPSPARDTLLDDNTPIDCVDFVAALVERDIPRPLTLTPRLVSAAQDACLRKPVALAQDRQRLAAARTTRAIDHGGLGWIEQFDRCAVLPSLERSQWQVRRRQDRACRALPIIAHVDQLQLRKCRAQLRQI